MTTYVVTNPEPVFVVLDDQIPDPVVVFEAPMVVIADGEGPQGLKGDDGDTGPSGTNGTNGVDGAASIPPILDGGNF